MTEAEEGRERERRRRAAEAEARRLRELEALASRQAETWAQVESLIEEKKTGSYDHAVHLLLKLRDLAKHHRFFIWFGRVEGLGPPQTLKVFDTFRVWGGVKQRKG